MSSENPDKQIIYRIERAKWLISNIQHAAIATVNEDGSPHNSPVFLPSIKI